MLLGVPIAHGPHSLFVQTVVGRNAAVGQGVVVNVLGHDRIYGKVAKGVRLVWNDIVSDWVLNVCYGRVDAGKRIVFVKADHGDLDVVDHVRKNGVLGQRHDYAG